MNAPSLPVPGAAVVWFASPARERSARLGADDVFCRSREAQTRPQLFGRSARR